MERLRGVFLKMPPKLLHVLAEKYQIAIPDDVTELTLPEYLLQELSDENKVEIYSNYGYAGRVVCRFFGAKTKNPSLEELQSTCMTLPIEPDKAEILRPNTPFLEYHEIDENNQLVRLRFKYLHESQSVYDSETQTTKEWFPLHHGTAVIRPQKGIVEIRVTDRRMAMPIVTMVMKYLKLPYLYRLNLYTERCIARFLQWIKTLNNARFTFGAAEDLSSVSISAKEHSDLRTNPKFKEYFDLGFLRGGHATIQRNYHHVNFRIFFR
jgi:hypothetical protein